MVLHRVRGSARLQSKHLLSSVFLISLELLYFPVAAFMQRKPWATREPKVHQLYAGATPVLMLGCALPHFLFRMQDFQAQEGKTFVLFPKETLMYCSHCLPTAHHKSKTIKCTRHGESLFPIGLPPPSCLVVQSSYEEAASLAEEEQQKPKAQLPKSERRKKNIRETDWNIGRQVLWPISSFVCCINRSIIIINLRT